MSDRRRILQVQPQLAHYFPAGNVLLGRRRPHDSKEAATGYFLIHPRVLQNKLEVNSKNASGPAASLDVTANPEEGFRNSTQHRFPSVLLLLLLLLLVASVDVLVRR